jgi:hypothetical protein
MINMNFFQKFYFEFPTNFYIWGVLSYKFFLENFIDGIIPPKTRQNVIYKGGYGRGEGVPIPYRGVLTIILGGVGVI